MYDTPDRQPESSFDRDFLLELLVDEELAAHDRDELLAQLSAEPDGWRDIAEAFLTAQSLTRSMRSVERRHGKSTDKHRALARQCAQASVVAAAVLVAFAIGFAWPHTQPIRGAGSMPQVGHQEVPLDDEQDQEPGAVRQDAEREGTAWAAVSDDERTLRVEFRKITDGGVTRYATYQELPSFMLQAVADAGHSVSQTLHQASAGEPTSDTELNDLEQPVSFVETQITPEFWEEL